MGEIKAVRFCGFGGQGIVLAGIILGYAATKDGKWVAESNSYGSAARGSNCRADVIISDEPIIYPHVISADIMVVMAQKAYNTYLVTIKKDGLVIYDEQSVEPKLGNDYRHIKVPATIEAVQRLNNRQVANIILLSTTVDLTKIVSHEAFMSAVKEYVPERFINVNTKAVKIGRELFQKIQEEGLGK
jgi:2-oxoglutarate ferredoxin oxidoreductase subunit gamma